MNQRLNNCNKILQYAIKHKISASSACTKLSKGKNYVSNFLDLIEKRKANGIVSQEEYSNFKSLYQCYLKSITTGFSGEEITNPILKNILFPETNTVPLKVEKNNLISPLTAEELKDIEYNAELDDSYDERSNGEIIRDEKGKIKGYKYKILIRNQLPLEGSFSREEMDRVYRYYSNMDGGGGLTLREVCREFPHLTFRDFKRILRAFNITKQSIAFAPHILEEYKIEEILEYTRLNKENNYLKKAENERGRLVEKSLQQAQKKILDLESDVDFVQNIVEKYVERRDLNDQSLPIIKNVKGKATNLGKPTVCLFGDIHYGKRFSRPRIGRGYNKEIAHERVMKIAEHVITDFKHRYPSEISLICVGDLVECVLEDGMHPAHTHEMDLLGDEQVFFAVDSLRAMIMHIKNNVTCPVKFHSIHGNHDRIGSGRDEDKGRTAGRIISGILKRELENVVDFHIPNNNLLNFTLGKLSFFVQHGDSPLSKKKPSDLVNIYGEPGCHSVLVQGHWHCYKVEEGTRFSSIRLPSVASTDKYILEELGNNNMPGFVLGHEAEDSPGFDFKKITLY